MVEEELEVELGVELEDAAGAGLLGQPDLGWEGRKYV